VANIYREIRPKRSVYGRLAAMHSGDKKTIAGVILGVAAGGVYVTGPLAFPSVLPEVWQGFFWLMIVIMAISASYFALIHTVREDRAMPISFMVVGGMLFFAGAIWLGLTNERGQSKQASGASGSETIDLSGDPRSYSDAKLKEATFLLANRLRMYENSHYQYIEKNVFPKYSSHDIHENDMSKIQERLDEEQRQLMAELKPLKESYLIEYRKEFTPKIEILRKELSRRLGVIPPIPRTGIEAVDNGMPGVGKGSLNDAAMYLESMARQLP
jgi:DNA-binding transcriptional ArsR family regulator